jgi:uncharacterized protein YdeI (YjbR/CyaY-like superfamily)
MKTIHVTTRAAWRRWLQKHHDTEREVWLVSYRPSTGRVRLPYNDAVEEALCFGWIDSNQKRIDDERTAQRFTPRRRPGGFSEMNKQRAQRLVAEGRMTKAGLAVLGDALEEQPLKLAPDVRRALQAAPGAWRNFEAFPEGYRRIRIAYIEGARGRPEEFRRRLDNFVKRTAKNQRIGYVPEFR